MVVRPIYVEMRGRSEEVTQSPKLARQQRADIFVLLLQIMIWNLDTKEAVVSNPVKILDAHKDVVLSMSFNTDGSLLATACRDRKIRLIDPRAGTVLQVGWVQRFVSQLSHPLKVFVFWVDSLPLNKMHLCPVLPKAPDGAIAFHFPWHTCCHSENRVSASCYHASCSLKPFLMHTVFTAPSCSPLWGALGGLVEIRWTGGCKCTLVPLPGLFLWPLHSLSR